MDVLYVYAFNYYKLYHHLELWLFISSQSRRVYVLYTILKQSGFFSNSFLVLIINYLFPLLRKKQKIFFAYFFQHSRDNQINNKIVYGTAFRSINRYTTTKLRMINWHYTIIFLLCAKKRINSLGYVVIFHIGIDDGTSANGPPLRWNIRIYIKANSGYRV